jgi:hypothetical protein
MLKKYFWIIFVCFSLTPIKAQRFSISRSELFQKVLKECFQKRRFLLKILEPKIIRALLNKSETSTRYESGQSPLTEAEKDYFAYRRLIETLNLNSIQHVKDFSNFYWPLAECFPNDRQTASEISVALREAYFFKVHFYFFVYNLFTDETIPDQSFFLSEKSLYFFFECFQALIEILFNDDFGCEEMTDTPYRELVLNELKLRMQNLAQVREQLGETMALPYFFFYLQLDWFREKSLTEAIQDALHQKKFMVR